jgi:Asp-tRNA(Asn)/Glu-tRNA(Gln) amidotransferase C subunit
LSNKLNKINKLVEKLNKIPNKNWSAGAYDELKDKTIEEINEIRGLKPSFSKNADNILRNRKVKNVFVGDLPKSLDWSNVTGEAKN